MLKKAIIFSFLITLYTHTYALAPIISFENFGDIFPIDFRNIDDVLDLLETGENFVPHDTLTDYGSYFPIQDEPEPPRVNVPELGTARGKIMTALFGTEFFAFHSIPYALPNYTRFQMAEPWEGAWTPDIEDDYDASFLRAKCPQSSLVVPYPGGREDCLHISIYTPTTIIDEPDKKYPVMFYIHGGGFISGDASLYVPTKLMDKEVVVVVVQYRLGSLGFLAAETPDNPGNMGLFDQVLALRWIQKYISYFGGDESKVTVFGQSAGAASSSWMQLTPATSAERNNGKQLLHRVILESGSALEVWALDRDPKGSFKLEAEALGCWDSNAAVALECMRNKTTVEATQGYLSVFVNDRLAGGLGFSGNAPVEQSSLIENYPLYVDNNPELVVVPDYPLRLIKQAEFLDVPMMAGSVRDEGSLVIGSAYEDFLVPNNLTANESFLAIEAVPFFINSFGISDTTGAVSNSLELLFLKNAEMGNFSSMSPGMVDMTGMLFLKSGMWSLTHLLTRSSLNVFFYSFEFESNDSIFPWYFMSDPDIPIEGGIAHADDLLYLFHLPSVMDERQQAAVKKITQLWANFAKYGDPTPDDADEADTWEDLTEKWTPFTFEYLEYMLISDEFTMQEDFKLRWNHNTIPDQNNSTETENCLPENFEEKTQSNLPSKDWQIAVGGLLVCSLIFIFVIIFLLFRSKN